MKEYIFIIINIILIFFGILIVLSFLANLVGRANTYSDRENARKMELCLKEEVDFKSCYFGIYSGYVKFGEKN